MTTYTTPHFATGSSDRNVRSEPSLNRARPASAATYRTAGVTNEAALMSDGQTPDWQPGASRGMPKAAIGAIGAALVGGAALAIVLLSPSDKVTKQVVPDPIAQATSQNTAAQKSVDASTAAIQDINNNPPAAGNTAATDAAAAAATQQAATAPAVPAPVQAVTPDAPPVANAPVARVRHVPTPRTVSQPQPVQTAPVQQAAPVVTPDVPAPVVTPPAAVQPPAMQQTPDTPTVTPAPTPAPTPDTPAPTPAPTPNE